MEEDYRKKEIDPNQLFLLSFLVIFFRCVDSLAAADKNQSFLLSF